MKLGVGIRAKTFDDCNFWFMLQHVNFYELWSLSKFLKYFVRDNNALFRYYANASKTRHVTWNVMPLNSTVLLLREIPLRIVNILLNTMKNNLMCVGPCIIVITEEQEPTRCYLLFYCTSYRLNMFRALLCPSSGAHDYDVSTTLVVPFLG